MTVMVIARGLPKVTIGPRQATAEGITLKSPRIELTPWDLDSKGNQLGGIKLSEGDWKRLTEGKELYSQFTTFAKALAWFQAQGSYKFACPFTGKQFEDIKEYKKYSDELKAMVTSGD